MTNDFSTVLNRQQYEAVTNLKGPLLILAGAGSGKTRVITHRISSLISSGIPLSSILAVTFTNKAAREMVARIRSLDQRKKLNDLTVCTFHALGLKILIKFGDLLGFKGNLTIYDQTDKQSLIKELLHELNFESEFTDAWQISALLSAIKTSRKSWNEEIQQYRAIFEEYNTRLKLLNAVDFDDLIVLPVKLFGSFPDSLSYYQNKFQYIMVDEFQDTSSRQYELIKLLAVEHRNICVVGDDDQSIYSWRGASFENITRFERDFPERLEIKLEQNYRSMRNILIAANCLIANNKIRKSKELWTKGDDGEHIQIFFPEDERQEADFIADHIHSLAIKQGIPLNQFGVLVRTNNLMRILEEAFRRENLPYRVSGGLSFYQRKEVKDLIAYLRVLANPDDNTNLLRIINTPRRGIGKKALEFIIETAEINSCSHFSSIALIAEKDQPAVDKKMRESIGSFYNLIEQYREKFLSGKQMALNLQSLVDSIEYRAFLFQEYQKPATARLKYDYYVLGLIESLADYQNDPENLEPGLFNYLNLITLANLEDSTGENDQDRINLMTIHASKGLEFEVVFIAAVEKDIIPHIRSQESGEINIEEERRIFYVALTRAMSKLYISAAATRKKHGKLIETEPSPFIAELPEELLRIQEKEVPVTPDQANRYFSDLKKLLAVK